MEAIFFLCVFSFMMREAKSTLLLFLVIFCLVSSFPFYKNNNVHYVFTWVAPECIPPISAGGMADKSTNQTIAITDQRWLLFLLTATCWLSHFQSVPSTLQNRINVCLWKLQVYICITHVWIYIY